MTGRIYFCLTAVTMCMWAGRASADLPDVNTYQYIFGQEDFTVMPGGIVEVPVYFQETVGLQDTSVLAPGGVGIVGAGLQVTTGGFPQPTEPARVAALSDIIPNPAFDFSAPSLSLTGANLALGKLEGSAVHGEECSQGVYRLLLGTFLFTAGNVLGESTPICAGQYDPGFANFVTENEIVLDPYPLPDARAMITVVPEPGSLVSLAAAVLAVMAWQIGSRKLSPA